MPKRNIGMTDHEVDEFLRVQHTVVVVAGPVFEAPLGAVGRFHYDSARVALTLHDHDPVVEQLQEDDRVCCVVDQFPSYYEIIGVMLHGHARRRAASVPGEAAFDVTVMKVVSFDFGKLLEAPEDLARDTRVT